MAAEGPRLRHLTHRVRMNARTVLEIYLNLRPILPCHSGFGQGGIEASWEHQCYPAINSPIVAGMTCAKLPLCRPPITRAGSRGGRDGGVHMR